MPLKRDDFITASATTAGLGDAYGLVPELQTMQGVVRVYISYTVAPVAWAQATLSYTVAPVV